jgi:membrane-bound serine protease (ClpP class)
MKMRRVGSLAAPLLLLAAIPVWANGSPAPGGPGPLVLLGLFLAGLACLEVELFLIPGFGVTGVTGIGLLMTHVALLFRRYPGEEGWTILGVEMVVSLVATVAAMKVLPKTALGRSMVHSTRLDASAPREADLDPDLWVGRTGEAVGSLRPSGTVRIDDRDLAAKSRRGLVAEGSRVRVVAVEGSTLVIEPENTKEDARG